MRTRWYYWLKGVTIGGMIGLCLGKQQYVLLALTFIIWALALLEATFYFKDVHREALQWIDRVIEKRK